MPRVYDCVLLTDELDLLEARFREYENIPEVTHVICEAPVDYQGNPKPLHFWDNRKGRFAGWHGRWTHVRVEPQELPDADPRARKNALREYLLHGFSGEPGDIILHGGIDEIPADWVVRRLAAGESPLPVVIGMRHCAYTAGLVHPLPWQGSAAQARKDVTTLTDLRENRGALPVIVSAGTRLSMMGEASPAREDGAVLHPDGNVLRAAEVDETWPRWISEGGCPAAWLGTPAS